MRTMAIALAVLVGTLQPRSSCGEIYTGLSENNAGAIQVTSTAYDVSSMDHVGADMVSTSGWAVSIDWKASTITLQNASLSATGGTLDLVDSFTVGPGQTAEIFTHLSFDSLSLFLAESETYGLVPETNGFYSISRNYSTSLRFRDVMLSGSYEVIGPTETRSGTFEVTGDVVSPIIDRFNRIDTDSYPHYLTAGYFGSYMFADDLTPGLVVDVTVDGVDVDVALNFIGFDSNTFRLVPEPATLSLLMLGGLALVRRRRRR